MSKRANKQKIIAHARKLCGSRSKWDRAVQKYITDIMAMKYDDQPLPRGLTHDGLEKWLLWGAPDWQHASSGGSFLVYDRDLMARLCTKTDIKVIERCRNPEKYDLIEAQGRALYQAARFIHRAYRELGYSA